MGFIAKKKVKKPFLTKKHQMARLQWAKVYQSWIVDDWKKVI